MKTSCRDGTLQLPIPCIDLPLRMSPCLSAWFHVDLLRKGMLEKQLTKATCVHNTKVS